MILPEALLRVCRECRRFLQRVERRVQVLGVNHAIGTGVENEQTVWRDTI